MMRQSRWTVGLVALVVMLMVGFGSLEAQDAGVTGETPVLLTSCGQSPGPTFVKLFLGRLGLDYELEDQATAQDLIDRQAAGSPFKSLIIVTGASLKGMGAAGVSMREELIRTEALIAEAKKPGPHHHRGPCGGDGPEGPGCGGRGQLRRAVHRCCHALLRCDGGAAGRE